MASPRRRRTLETNAATPAMGKKNPVATAPGSDFRFARPASAQIRAIRVIRFHPWLTGNANGRQNGSWY